MLQEDVSYECDAIVDDMIKHVCLFTLSGSLDGQSRGLTSSKVGDSTEYSMDSDNGYLYFLSTFVTLLNFDQTLVLYPVIPRCWIYY